MVGKGWHFDERWIRYENGKQMLNTSVAIADCLEAGWDENDSRMMLWARANYPPPKKECQELANRHSYWVSDFGSDNRRRRKNLE